MATRHHEGIVFHATAVVGSLPVATTAGCCEAASAHTRPRTTRFEVTVDMDRPIKAAVEAPA
ncbi:hypothetical protein [Streptomyces hirsutus]|uniref:hypothetical protein n=1 Tax=Streptomyces hirsutus TaxID=35620 RepID=UPI003D15F444